MPDVDLPVNLNNESPGRQSNLGQDIQQAENNESNSNRANKTIQIIMTAQNDSPNIIRQRAQTVNRQSKENELAQGGKTYSPMKLLQKNNVWLKGSIVTITVRTYNIYVLLPHLRKHCFPAFFLFVLYEKQIQ